MVIPVINLTQPFTAILCLAAVICAIFLGHEIKRAVVPAIALIICLLLLVMHTLQLFVWTDTYIIYQKVLSISIVLDFGFVLMTYMSYLCIDDIEAKYRNKKSIDNSLDWFWNKVV